MLTFEPFAVVVVPFPFTEAQTLHKQLRLKFNDLPDWVKPKINQADKAQLDHWVERILFVNSLDELFKP